MRKRTAQDDGLKALSPPETHPPRRGIVEYISYLWFDHLSLIPLFSGQKSGLTILQNF